MIYIWLGLVNLQLIKSYSWTVPKLGIETLSVLVQFFFLVEIIADIYFTFFCVPKRSSVMFVDFNSRFFVLTPVYGKTCLTAKVNYVSRPARLICIKRILEPWVSRCIRDISVTSSNFNTKNNGSLKQLCLSFEVKVWQTPFLITKQSLSVTYLHSFWAWTANMSRPTMLRYGVLTCCDRLGGAYLNARSRCVMAINGILREYQISSLTSLSRFLSRFT